MNWLSRLVPPRIKALVRQDVPDNLWDKCPSCGEMIFHRDLYVDKHVCRYCGYHLHFPVEERFKDFFDSDFSFLPAPNVKMDPLGFRDNKKYTDRIKEYKIKSNSAEAISSAEGVIDGLDIVASVFNFKFMGGSMGTFVGESIIAAIERAIEKSSPYVIFTASGGARMQEGMLSLMQMPRTVAAVVKLKAKKLPYIVVLTNPTTGGVSASFAMLGDVHIAEPGAIVGFAGARVIKDTIRQDLPKDFQTAEYLLDHGMVDMIVPRAEIKAKVIKICKLLMNK